MRIVLFEELDNDYKIGYSENGFVVYGMISKELTVGFTRSQILQECYKQVREAVAYENRQLVNNKLPSIPYNPVGGEETFNPEGPLPAKIVIGGKTNYTLNEQITESYTATVYDQYGDVLNSPVVWTSDNEAFLPDGSITLTPVAERTTFTITVTCGNASASLDVVLDPYVEPVVDPNFKSDAEKIEELQQLVADLASLQLEV